MNWLVKLFSGSLLPVALTAVDIVAIKYQQRIAEGKKTDVEKALMLELLNGFVTSLKDELSGKILGK